MTLSNDVRTLRARVIDDLGSAHDYYEDTKTAWELVIQFIATGQTITTRNVTTGTVTTEADLAAKSQAYVAEQLAEATSQQFISLFESFYLISSDSG